MVGEIVLNKKGIEICRELIRKGCLTRESAKKIAVVMKALGHETVEDVLIVLFSEDAFDETVQASAENMVTCQANGNRCNICNRPFELSGDFCDGGHQIGQQYPKPK